MNYPDSSGVGEYQQQPQNERNSAGPNADSGTRNGPHNEFIQKVNNMGTMKGALHTALHIKIMDVNLNRKYFKYLSDSLYI